MQPQGHVQVLLNILRGMTPQAALDAPRFCISAGLPSADNEDAEKSGKSAGEVNSEVYIEEGVSDEVFDKLRGGQSPLQAAVANLDRCFSLEMGHDARRAQGFSRAVAGRGQVSCQYWLEYETSN